MNRLSAWGIATLVACPTAIAAADVLHLPLASDAPFTPFGCRGYNETWTAGAPLTLHSWPDKNARVLTTIPKGATFRTFKGRIIVTKPVDVVVSRTMNLYNWGQKEGPSLCVKPGDHVYVLNDQGEEGHRIWHKGKDLRAVCLRVTNDGKATYAEWDPDPKLNQMPQPLGKLAPGSPKEPIYQWWVYVRDLKHSEGWIEVKDNGQIKDLFSCYD